MSLRVVMGGTGPFAVPTFRALCDSGHTVCGLVTQPLRPQRGSRSTIPTPMRDVAIQRGIALFDPDSINTPESQARLAQWQADVLVVADYGQILAPETLATARLGGVNLHGSLLPKYRGAAPINWCIFHGERETGVSVIRMTPRVDAGPVVAHAAVEIGPDESAPELELRLAALGAPLVVDVINQLQTGELAPLAQDPAQATTARRLRKSDSEVDWSRSAAAIHNQVRALEPWPRTSTHWLRANAEPLRLILCRVSVVANRPASAQPGTVEPGPRDQLLVATGDGLLCIQQLQPAGKRPMTAAEFLRGHNLLPGQRLGPATS